MAELPSRIIVAGAGPAGVVTAERLAELGHRVTLLAPRRRRPAVEGLSFRVLEGLRIAGLPGFSADRLEPVRRTVWWNGEEGESGREWLVERAAFDAALARAARRFAEVVPGRLAAVEGTGEAGGETMRCTVRRADGSHLALDADFLVDARGRGAPGGQPRRVGPRTLAICRFHGGGTLPPGTWIESGPEGWAWLAVREPGEAYLQVTVGDPRGLPGGGALAGHLDRLTAGFPQISRLLAAAGRPGPVLARLAGVAVADQPAAARRLRVGDAALALDPLSGHGVFEAIAGGFAAAAVVNTILGRPGDAALARRFYRDRLHANFVRRTLDGRSHYRREARWPAAAFWAERQRFPGEEPDIPSASRVETRPVIDGGWIREARVIVTPDQPRGVWRLDGVPVVPLLELDPGDPEQAAAALGCPVAAAASALAWLERTGLRHGGLRRG